MGPCETGAAMAPEPSGDDVRDENQPTPGPSGDDMGDENQTTPGPSVLIVALGLMLAGHRRRR